MAVDRQHAHQRLDQLGPGQLEAVVHLPEMMVAPGEASDENGNTLSRAEREAIAKADEWLRHNEPIAHEEVLAEFGLTMADWVKMGDELLPAEPPRRSARPGERNQAYRLD